MQEDKNNILPQDKDRHLDVPAEARRDNKINFLETDETDNDNDRPRVDDETKERQRQWKEGLEEGKRLRDEG